MSKKSGRRKTNSGSLCKPKKKASNKHQNYYKRKNKSQLSSSRRRRSNNSKKVSVHSSTASGGDQRCWICNAHFHTSQSLQKHMDSPVHDPQIIPCPHCQRLFKTTSGVSHHLECKYLNKVTDAVVQWDTEHQITKPEYTNRIKEVDSNSFDDSEDEIVTKRDESVSVLSVMPLTDAHMDVYTCPMPGCLQSFQTVHSLNQHLSSQKHRTNPDTFHCPKCFSHFSVVSALIQHIESEACGIARRETVKTIYTDQYDIFKKLIKF
ncbi:hypothetical protein M408DRAFT_328948 [Serendipita vermifera MAFF 305830]|uniref:Ig-like domain-containing protein n=1 Tax=Serendipita vermifera MAFF 305830 TaxID=933852 RepID=A0A0C2XJR9_SERVB|nr:hypothetical protein M408DRAFT_328948 [Serendipita vermifera MAFF 305830]